MSAKHTPGPWYADVRSGCLAVYPESDKARWWCLSGANEDAIHYSNKGSHYIESPNGGHWEMSAEAIANAHLIAAAPEMYAKIEELRDTIKWLHGIFQTTYSGEARIVESDELLKKARGES